MDLEGRNLQGGPYRFCLVLTQYTLPYRPYIPRRRFPSARLDFCKLVAPPQFCYTCPSPVVPHPYLWRRNVCVPRHTCALLLVRDRKRRILVLGRRRTLLSGIPPHLVAFYHTILCDFWNRNFYHTLLWDRYRFCRDLMPTGQDFSAAFLALVSRDFVPNCRNLVEGDHTL